ncbi:MAG: acyl-CoA dehydrogenase [Vicinamibacteria bacterium]|nr:acyl-CoA dehydrogenase [Vicinamibacteria bacterium]
MIFDRFAPKISATERQALDAGTVWLERSIFAGRLNWGDVAKEAYPTLTVAEQAFLDGPCEAVCRAVNPWLCQETMDLPVSAWEILKRERFFGLTLARERGGRGFSALGLTAIVAKLGSHSMPLAVAVLIPNSVGPGELIERHGTDAQKREYLEALACGDEMPAFALTEPMAGSDAGSITSRGRVFRDIDGELKIELNWRKRYITLAPIATILGLAVVLEDPQDLLGEGPNPGITCVLVKTSLPGAVVGRRHDAMGVAFPNGPTEGENVIVPASDIIGGYPGAGRGWAMLMEALSAGRGLSLPAQSAGGIKRMARVTTAYAQVRRQFGTAIARFEGIKEKLSSILVNAYLSDAARVFVAGAVMEGQRPSVVSAIAKYEQTEMARRAAMDSMDILGGAALCRGPKNPLLMALEGSSIQITVEGANILTRTLIIFGQGVLRGHPYALKHLKAIESGFIVDAASQVFRHAAFSAWTLLRLAFAEITRGVLADPSAWRAPLTSEKRRLSWAALRFAALADLTLLVNGPALKRKGHANGRLADALSAIFFGIAAVRRAMHEERTEKDPLVRAAVESCLARADAALLAVLREFEAPLLRPLLRGPALWWARLNPLTRGPRDADLDAVVEAYAPPGAARDALTAGISLGSPHDPLTRLDAALAAVTIAAPIEKRIALARQAGRFDADTLAEHPDSDISEAFRTLVITSDEAGAVARARSLAREVVEVDDFETGTLFQTMQDAQWRASQEPV